MFFYTGVRQGEHDVLGCGCRAVAGVIREDGELKTPP